MFRVVVAALTIVLVPMVIMALSFVVAVIRRMPFIVDSNGIITPEMVSAGEAGGLLFPVGFILFLYTLGTK